MTKETKNENSKASKDRVKSQEPAYNAGEEERTYRPIRKIMTPVVRGTVSRSAIRKAVREVIAERSASNAS
jgi:hypothetical protein